MNPETELGTQENEKEKTGEPRDIAGTPKKKNSEPQR